LSYEFVFLYIFKCTIALTPSFTKYYIVIAFQIPSTPIRKTRQPTATTQCFECLKKKHQYFAGKKLEQKVRHEQTLEK